MAEGIPGARLHPPPQAPWPHSRAHTPEPGEGWGPPPRKLGIHGPEAPPPTQGPPPHIPVTAPSPGADPTHLGKLGDAPGPLRGWAAVGGPPAPGPRPLHGPQGGRLPAPSERRLQRAGQGGLAPKAGAQPRSTGQRLPSALWHPASPAWAPAVCARQRPGRWDTGDTHPGGRHDKVPACPCGADIQLSHQ